MTEDDGDALRRCLERSRVTENVDLIVLGGGVMGSAAAWAAARAGKNVILLEQFEFGHDNGASHGTARNFNQAYEHDDYLHLLAESLELWNELSDDQARPLLDHVGLVNHGWVEPLRRVREGHERRGIASEFISAKEASDRWTGLKFRSDVLYIPGSGRVRSADALRSFRDAAEQRSAQFRYDSRVVCIRVLGPDDVIVTTEDDEYRAPRVIVTAGAWTAGLLGGSIPLPPLVVTEEHPAHFVPRTVAMQWPSFNHSPDPAAPEDSYWLSPTYGLLTPGEGVKIGWHGVGNVVDPDHRPRHPVPEQMSALRRYVTEWVPGVDPDRFDVISCTYTTTPTDDFVLDRVGPIIVGAGFSGHGFKFAPAIGRVLVDLADDRAPAARFRARIPSARVHEIAG